LPAALALGIALAVVCTLWAGVAGAATLSGAATGTAPGGSGAPGDVQLTSSTSLQTCLKAHGITLPKGTKTVTHSQGVKPPKGFKPPKGATRSKDFKPPKGFKPTKESKKLEAALKACGASTGFFGGASHGAAVASAIKAYLGCLSSHGVKVTKKDDSARAISTLSSQSAFPAANKTCSVLLPSSASSSSTTTTTPPGASSSGS
jgi:hypothetical protein